MWDDDGNAWYIPCYGYNIEKISPHDQPWNRAIFHYEGPTSFDIDGILAHGDGSWNYIDRFCVPQNHFYWASETGTYECTDFTDQLTTYNLMTIYIDIWHRESFHEFRFYNGTVLSSSIQNINITARGRTENYAEKAVLTLYWNWYTYECTISFNNTVTSYSCDVSDLNLSNSNCPKYAYAVGVEMYSGPMPYIESISVTDEDGTIQIMNKTISTNQSAIAVDFTTVWSRGSLDVYRYDLNSMCFLGSRLFVFCYLH